MTFVWIDNYFLKISAQIKDILKILMIFRCSLVVKNLPSIHKAMGSILSTAKINDLIFTNFAQHFWLHSFVYIQTSIWYNFPSAWRKQEHFLNCKYSGDEFFRQFQILKNVFILPDIMKGIFPGRKFSFSLCCLCLEVVEFLWYIYIFASNLKCFVFFINKFPVLPPFHEGNSALVWYNTRK